MNRSFCRMAASTLLLAVISTSISARSQRWEHNLYEGVGVVNKFEDNDDQKTAFHVGYGLNYYITPNWSVMPGVALRFKALGKDNGNSGNCASTYIDVPLLVQYHFGGDKRKGMVVECGPVVSFLAHSNTYDGKYWNTWNPYEGEKMYKHFDVGIRPAVYYETGHWRFGVQSHVGFLDIKRKFPDRPYASFFDNKYHAMSLVATVYYHW